MTRPVFFVAALLFTLLGIVLVLPMVASAQSARVALVIGNGDYTRAPLKNPANDANDMARALESIGFDVIEKVNADREEMLRAIYDFGRKLNHADVGIFYYAGHGMQVQGTNYLIPVDARVESESDVQFEAVNAGRVLGKMHDSGNRLNIVILDACRDNPFARSFRTAETGLAQMNAPAGSIVAYATAPGSVAIDGDGRNGVYTGHLLKNITAPGLSVQDVLMETGLEVMKVTNRQQIPWVSSSPVPRYYLAGKDSVPLETPPEKKDAASLKVRTDPPGARLYVNGRYRGTAPAEFGDLPPGRYEIEAKKDGYETESRTVSLTADHTAQVTMYLAAVKQAVDVEATAQVERVDPFAPHMRIGFKAGPLRRIKESGYFGKMEGLFWGAQFKRTLNNKMFWGIHAVYASGTFTLYPDNSRTGVDYNMFEMYPFIDYYIARTSRAGFFVRSGLGVNIWEVKGNERRGIEKNNSYDLLASLGIGLDFMDRFEVLAILGKVFTSEDNLEYYTITIGYNFEL